MATQTIPLNETETITYNNQNVSELYLGSQKIWPVNIPYLTFESVNTFTLKTYNGAYGWDGIIEYSNDTINWATWTGQEISSSANGKLYLRGTGNTVIGGSGTGAVQRRFTFTGTNIYCKGNIENLLDYATVALGNHPIMADNCFRRVFQGNANLISGPELPSTTLASYCYEGLFFNCTGLVTAPNLPATVLQTQCYYNMFRGCSNLINAPSIQATTLTAGCCRNMFEGCINLTSLPKLVASVLADECYYEMFKGCSKIKLSATQTGEYQTEYRIPENGTGSEGTYSLYYMFTNTGGTFTGTPTINTTYYTLNTIV